MKGDAPKKQASVPEETEAAPTEQEAGEAVPAPENEAKPAGFGLISKTSFSNTNGEIQQVRVEPGERYHCDFVLWIGPYGYCFSATGKKPFDPAAVKVFLTETDDDPEAPRYYEIKKGLHMFIDLDGTQLRLGGIRPVAENLLNNDYDIYIGETFASDGGAFEEYAVIVSPLETVFGIDTALLRVDEEAAKARTGGAVMETDKRSGRIRFREAEFYVWEGEYTYSWRYRKTDSECTVTDDTVLTVRDFADIRDMLVTKDEFFRLMEEGYLYFDDSAMGGLPVEDPVEYYAPCFIGTDALGNALYVAEAPIWDPAC